MKTNNRSKLFLIFGLIAALVLTALLVVGLCDRAQETAYAAETEAVAVADETAQEADTAAEPQPRKERAIPPAGRRSPRALPSGLPQRRARSAWASPLPRPTNPLRVSRRRRESCAPRSCSGSSLSRPPLFTRSS